MPSLWYLWLIQRLMLGFSKKLKTFCNAMDDINHCNCYASAIVRRGSLQIAISTAGKNPALVQRLQGIRRTVRQAICSGSRAWENWGAFCFMTRDSTARPDAECYTSTRLRTHVHNSAPLHNHNTVVLVSYKLADGTLIRAWRRAGEGENHSRKQHRVTEIVDPLNFDIGARI